MAQSRSFNNPAEKQGLVVMNATLDLAEIRRRRSPNDEVAHFASTDANDEVFTIQPHDLCFRALRTNAVARSYNDTEYHVVGSVNRMKVKNKTNPADNRQKLLGRYEFAGVAVNRAVFDRRTMNANEMNFPVQVGGVCTIQNTGSEPISIGQYVMWDLPSTNSKGPNSGMAMHGAVNKQHFLVKSYKAEQEVSDAEWTQGREYVLEKLDGARSRIIGKAMSSADSGYVFDVLLGHYNM